MAPTDPSPLVTAIVPAFNAEAWIATTLASVAAQTWANLEILIVDDGSTDGTAAIAEAFCRKDSRARLLRQPNGGVASARNLGIAQARGEWIAPVDADDLWHPARVEKMVRRALATPERPALVYCWSRLIDEAGRVIGSGEAHEWQGRALKRLSARNAVGNGSALLIRTEAVRAVGGYDEGLFERGMQGTEDALLQLEIAALHPIACVPEYLVGYRVTAGTMSADPERMYRSWSDARQIFQARHGALTGPGPRWARARRLFDLAEGRANAGRVGGAAASLARAIVADPARVGAQMLYRAARLVRRAATPQRRRGERPLFENCAATGHIEGDADAIAAPAGLLARWDRRRFERLEREEGR